jgi:hypothetical protein
VPRACGQTEPIRLDSKLVPKDVCVNEAHFHLNNVNTCVYAPSVFRVLVNWPRAPIYLPVPPNTAHDRLARIKFGGGRWIIDSAESDNLILAIAKSEKQKRRALLGVWVGLSNNRDQLFEPNTWPVTGPQSNSKRAVQPTPLFFA